MNLQIENTRKWGGRWTGISKFPGLIHLGIRGFLVAYYYNEDKFKRFNEGGETMIDTVQAISRRKAKEYLEKKDKQKKMKRNIITGLIFLAALILLAIFY